MHLHPSQACWKKNIRLVYQSLFLLFNTSKPNLILHITTKWLRATTIIPQLLFALYHIVGDAMYVVPSCITSWPTCIKSSSQLSCIYLTTNKGRLKKKNCILAKSFNRHRRLKPCYEWCLGQVKLSCTCIDEIS